MDCVFVNFVTFCIIFVEKFVCLLFPGYLSREIVVSISCVTRNGGSLLATLMFVKSVAYISSVFSILRHEKFMC